MTQVGDNPARAPKRFYKEASVNEAAGAFAIALDGRMAKTRRARLLAAPTRPLAGAVAAEWNAQGDAINFLSMPLTRALMTAIDLGEDDRTAWRETILSFLKSDLLCYRAAAPAELAARQALDWDPLLAFADKTFGARLLTANGVQFIEQPADAVSAISAAIAPLSDVELVALKAATEIAGSAVIALALWRGVAPADQLFDVSRLDEQFQREVWGEDDEAAARELRLREDFRDAERALLLARGSYSAFAGAPSA